jgi:hypothetical protein
LTSSDSSQPETQWREEFNRQEDARKTPREIIDSLLFWRSFGAMAVQILPTRTDVMNRKKTTHTLT